MQNTCVCNTSRVCRFVAAQVDQSQFCGVLCQTQWTPFVFNSGLHEDAQFTPQIFLLLVFIPKDEFAAILWLSWRLPLLYSNQISLSAAIDHLEIKTIYLGHQQLWLSCKELTASPPSPSLRQEDFSAVELVPICCLIWLKIKTSKQAAVEEPKRDQPRSAQGLYVYLQTSFQATKP